MFTNNSVAMRGF